METKGFNAMYNSSFYNSPYDANFKLMIIMYPEDSNNVQPQLNTFPRPVCCNGRTSSSCCY
jgi:hypothetical protein